MKRQVRDRETLASEIASLSKLGIDELRERWKAMFGKAPSRDISRSFLTRAIAYRLQEKAFAGLKPSTRRVLAELAHDGANESSLAAEPSRIVRPGAVLVREWRGISHRVSVPTLRGLHAEVFRRRAGAGLQLPARAARGV